MLAWELLPMALASEGTPASSRRSGDIDDPHSGGRHQPGAVLARTLYVVTALAAFLAVLAALIAIPSIGRSISRTMERMGSSAELQGRAVAGLTHEPIATLRSRSSAP